MPIFVYFTTHLQQIWFKPRQTYPAAVTSSLRAFLNIFGAFPCVSHLCTNLPHHLHECSPYVGHIRAECHHLLKVNYEAERIILANNFQWAKVIVHFHTSESYFSLTSTITQESGFIYLIARMCPTRPCVTCLRSAGWSLSTWMRRGRRDQKLGRLAGMIITQAAVDGSPDHDQSLRRGRFVYKRTIDRSGSSASYK